MCNITKDMVDSDCEFSIGGLTAIYLLNKKDTVVTSNASSGVTAITLGDGQSIFEYKFADNTANFDQVFSGAAINKNFLQTLNFQMINLDQEKKTEFEALSLSSLMAIPVDSNGNGWLLGEKGKGLKATVLTTNSGATEDDANSVTIALSGKNRGLANIVPQSLIDTLRD